MLSILVFQKLADKLHSPGKGIISWKLLSDSNIMRILPQNASAHLKTNKYYSNLSRIFRNTFRVLEEKNLKTLHRSYIAQSYMQKRATATVIGCIAKCLRTICFEQTGFVNDRFQQVTCSTVKEKDIHFNGFDNWL
jgi:hypothetical protein